MYKNKQAYKTFKTSLCSIYELVLKTCKKYSPSQSLILSLKIKCHSAVMAWGQSIGLLTDFTLCLWINPSLGHVCYCMVLFKTILWVGLVLSKQRYPKKITRTTVVNYCRKSKGEFGLKKNLDYSSGFYFTWLISVDNKC